MCKFRCILQRQCNNIRRKRSCGQTVISVTSESGFQIRDIVRFGTNPQEYRVTATATGTITIEALNQPAGTGLVEALSSTQVHRYWEFYNQFDKGSRHICICNSSWSSADEIHVVVVDEDGSISGKQHEVLETYGFVSCVSDAKDSQGGSNYYKTKINNQSKWVWWTGHSVPQLTQACKQSVTTHLERVQMHSQDLLHQLTLHLLNGADGSQHISRSKYGAYVDLFGDAETVDVSFLIVGSTRTSQCK